MNYLKSNIAVLRFDKLLMVSDTTISIIDLSKESEQILTKDIEIDVDHIQIMVIDGLILIIDLSKSKFIYIDKSLKVSKIDIPQIKTPYFHKYAWFNENELILDSGLGYYTFNIKTKVYEKYKSIMVQKHKQSFRKIAVKIGNLLYNSLYESKDLNTLLYHYHHGNTKSIIGVYKIDTLTKLIEFESPEKIECVNWYSGKTNENNTMAYSNVKGIIAGDKVVVCFHKILYVLDNKGNIIKKRSVENETRYWGLDLLNKEQLVISEINKKDPEKMNIFILDL